MKLKGIEPELAESLIAEGSITKESIVRAISKNPPPKFRKAVEMMHILMCHRDHDTGECEYYSETDWEMTFHTVWIEKVVKLTEDYSVDEVIDSLFNVKVAMENLSDPLSIDLFNKAFTPSAVSPTLLSSQSDALPEESEEQES